jgi:hypothetical protein
MGKRSNFQRRATDLYQTPRAAVVPLIPYLHKIRRFAEPCAGDGDLIRHLESFGLTCVYAGDIRTGQDALAVDGYGAADAIITNPPWTRALMHPLIAHFQRIAPTWLLLELDWASTRQAEPFMAACSDIVAIGRVKWIADSSHSSKDNFAWFRFDAWHAVGPVFHTHRSPRTRACAQCGRPYAPQRSSSRFCSGACRTCACRRRLSVTLSVTEAAP